MAEKVKQFFIKASTEGLYLPVAHDKGVPSVTLFLLYINNILAFLSLIYLHTKADPLTATLVTCIYSIIWAVLYLMRRIQSFKADLDDRSVELEGEDDEEPADRS